MKSAGKRMLQSLLFILTATWVLLCLLLYLFQDRYVYFPINGLVATPADAGLIYEEVMIKTPDGVDLHGWYIPHPRARATMLFLHGNGGNISHRLEKLLLYHALDLSVFIIDYRGYGRSTGRPTEAGTYTDAETAWSYLRSEKNVPAASILVYGESLGGAIAAYLAERQTPGALVLESAFTSIADMGKHFYPYLPVSLLTRIRYPSLARLPGIHAPLLVIHSSEDEIVPYTHGQTLYESAHNPKTLLAISGDHNSGFLTSGRRYTEGLDNFVTRWFPGNDHTRPEPSLQ